MQQHIHTNTNTNTHSCPGTLTDLIDFECTFPSTINTLQYTQKRSSFMTAGKKFLIS